MASIILQDVFPMAVGPTIVIRYFIFFLAQIETETPKEVKLIFLGVKERPEEAPFMPSKNNCTSEELQWIAGLASN